MYQITQHYRPMKILILQASPRKTGNTVWMAEEIQLGSGPFCIIFETKMPLEYGTYYY